LLFSFWTTFHSVTLSRKSARDIASITTVPGRQVRMRRVLLRDSAVASTSTWSMQFP
jgi:hypothetical protein